MANVMLSTAQFPTEPPKRQRKVHPKTRTGCRTCKIRKVKCGEERPHCKRCTSTGRKCDGYSSDQPIQFSSRRGSSPSTSLILPPQMLNTGIPGSAAEKRGFHYFVTNTAAELAGYFNEEFWRGFVLKACWERDNAALRHVVVGIGALHEEFERNGNGVGVSLEDGFAVGHHSKAISHLRHYLTMAKASDSPLTALVSSALFVCFDSLRGSLASAMVHLQSGLRILKDTRAQIKSQEVSNSRGKGKGISKEEEFIIEKHIAPLFVRLSVQAILYVDTRSVEEKTIMAEALGAASNKDSGNSEQQELGKKGDVFDESEWRFETLEDAREKLNFAAEGLFRMFWVCDGHVPLSAQTPQAASLHKTHSAALAHWSTCFSTFMSQHTPTLCTTQIRAATLLKIHHCVLQLMISAIPPCSDPRPLAEAMNAASTFTNNYATGLFATTVTLCRSFIAAVEQDALKAPGSVNVGKTGKTFSTDLGVVGPLYYVGTKCTVPSIRAEALSLLDRWKGREGMWDATMGGGLVREFWEVERRFGSRGYEVVNDIDMYDSSGEETDAAIAVFENQKGGMTRGRVTLLVGEGRKWEWKIQLATGKFITIPRELPGNGTIEVGTAPMPSAWVAMTPETTASASPDPDFDLDAMGLSLTSLSWDFSDTSSRPSPPLDFDINEHLLISDLGLNTGLQPSDISDAEIDWLGILQQQHRQSDTALLGFELGLGLE